MPELDITSWSARTRMLVAAAITVLVAAAVITAVVVSGQAHGDTTADGSASTVRSSYAPAQRATGTGSAVASGTDSPAETATPQSGAVLPSQIPLPYSEQRITAGASVAVDWVAGITAIRYDDDLAARATRLTAFLDDPADETLRRWLAPGHAAAKDLVTNRTVVTSQASITRIVTIARNSMLFEVAVTQNSRSATGKPATSTASYIVTVVPGGDTWKVTALIGATDGDPGY